MHMLKNGPSRSKLQGMYGQTICFWEHAVPVVQIHADITQANLI